MCIPVTCSIMKRLALFTVLFTALSFAGATAQVRQTQQKMTQQPKMKVEIWSDMVCPFCYMGKHRYEKALAQFAHRDDIEVVWHSFQLYPGMKKITTKENAYQYLARVKGISLDQSKQMHASVVQMAQSDGLQYNFDKTTVANSYNAHRLLQMAKKHGLASEAEEHIFKAYFTDGKDIDDIPTLTSIGFAIGLDKTAVEKMLRGTDFAAEVAADLKEADQIGITGVPFFVFDRKYAVSGAQPVDTFFASLQRAHSDWQQNKQR
jgi:predicted DsbA family dithiol-disulfide isomerase